MRAAPADAALTKLSASHCVTVSCSRRHCARVSRASGGRNTVAGKVGSSTKQFLKSTGDRSVPQGSPLSPLLANIALNDLDRVLDLGRGVLTYVRYLDDMVVLTPDSQKGRRWADRALERIRRETEAIGAQEREVVPEHEPTTVKGDTLASSGFGSAAA